MMTEEPVVIWRTAPRWSQRALLAELRKMLGGRVANAYLFGSHARGEASGESDVDLILVTDTKRPFPERGKDFLDVVHRLGAVDLLIYTPAEWAHMRRRPSGFWRRVRREAISVFPQHRRDR